MIGSKFDYLTDEQTGLIKDRVFDLLADYGVKLDPHPELFDLLAGAGAEVDRRQTRFHASPSWSLIPRQPAGGGDGRRRAALPGSVVRRRAASRHRHRGKARQRRGAADHRSHHNRRLAVGCARG